MLEATVGLLTLAGIGLFVSILSMRSLRRQSNQLKKDLANVVEMKSANIVKSDAMKMAAGGSTNNEISAATSGR